MNSYCITRCVGLQARDVKANEDYICRRCAVKNPGSGDADNDRDELHWGILPWNPIILNDKMQFKSQALTEYLEIISINILEIQIQDKTHKKKDKRNKKKNKQNSTLDQCCINVHHHQLLFYFGCGFASRQN